jgi:hypothetical protein
MGVIRLILLVAVMGGLTLLLAQNWSPALPLVFFGIKTQPLPLAMWILFSTTAGGFTSLFITSLFKLTNYIALQQRPTPAKPRFNSPRTSNQTRTEEPIPRPNSPPPPASKTQYNSRDTSDEDNEDDWGTNTNSDDWDFEERQEEEAPKPNSQTQQDRESKNYERQQEPKRSSQSGSVYSYSYREPKNSGVGKTESVYDADYRVIIPPYQASASNQADDANDADNSDDDDWGFFEDDDDFEDEQKDKRPRR